MTGTVNYTAYGAVRQLYRIRKWPRGMYQILLEGPAGTGKTRGLLEWVHWLCGTYPGIRVLFLRHTKESLAESVLETWESEVLWPGHECITGTAGVRNRQSYTFRNHSHIVLGGLADKRQTEKTLSTQFDVVIFFEARQIPDYDSWQMLARANRNWKIPWQLRIADTNPGPEFHWLNQMFPRPETGGAFRSIPKHYWEDPPLTIKCDEGHVSIVNKPRDVDVDEHGHVRYPCPVCEKPSIGAVQFRLLSRFQDNPKYWDVKANKWTPYGQEYVEGNLAFLTGAPRANLYEGRWASEEGVIYEDWDPAVHIIDPSKAPPMKWYFGSFDKGLRHPGCLQVWGVDGEDKIYLVREIYQTEQNIDWWAEQALKLNREFQLQALVCDPSEPEYIAKFNDFMGERRARDGERIARKAMNAILTGIDLVRWGLSKREGGPRMFVLSDFLDGVDQKRQAQMKPTSSVQEVGSYVWQKSEPGKQQREKPDPTCSDHGMDCWRYAAAFKWGRDLSPLIKPRAYDFDTLGNILGHADVMAASAGGWGLED